MTITKDVPLFSGERAGFKKVLNTYPKGKGVSDKAFNALAKKCDRMVLKKGEKFCIKGEVCETVGYIVSGYMYSYYIKEEDIDRKEMVTNLYFTPEYRIIADIESLYFGGVSHSTIKAASRTILICIPVTDLNDLLDVYPELGEVKTILLAMSYLENQHAREFFRRHNGHERVAALYLLNPEMFNIFTHKLIGSFLKVDPNIIGALISTLPKISRK
jgi:CRP-like cAMP-binding protein